MDGSESLLDLSYWDHKCISDAYDAILVEHNHFLHGETICTNATSAPSNVSHRTFLGSDRPTFLGIVAGSDRIVHFNRYISSTLGHTAPYLGIDVVRCHTTHDDAVDKIEIRLIACHSLDRIVIRLIAVDKIVIILIASHFLSSLTHYESCLARLSTGSEEILFTLIC